MGEYGYRYQSYSTYNTAGSRAEEAFGPSTRRPFVPFVPNPNRSSDGVVTRKTIVPVTNGPYDDEYKHSSPSEAYPTKDDDGWHRQTSPVRDRPQKVDEFLTKVQNEASRPTKVIPVTTNQSPQSASYNGANGYGGDYGNFNNKPIGGTIRKDNYDGYNGANGYGDYGSYNKEGHKPIGSTVRGDNYDGYKGANGYDDYGNYSNKEGRPIRNDNYDGNGYGDYGNYSNKGGLKPVGSPIPNDNYDRYRPAENYNALEPNRATSKGWTRPNISSGWTAQPKKGTQISEATNDIGKAIELLKDAAKVNGSVNGYGGEYNNRGGHSANGYAYPNDNYDSYQHRNSGVDRLVSPGNGSQLSEPINKLGKPMDLLKEAERSKTVGTAPYQSRTTLPIEPTTLNKDDYRETRDKRDNLRYGNFSSRPHTLPPTPLTIVVGREADNRDQTIDRNPPPSKRLGNMNLSNVTIDSKEAEKKYRGRTV